MFSLTAVKTFSVTALRTPNFKPSSRLLVQGVQARGLDLSMSESGSLEGGGWVIGLGAGYRGVPCREVC